MTNTKKMFFLLLILILTGCSVFKLKKSPVSADGLAPAIQTSSGSLFSDSSDVVFVESLDYASEALNQYSIEIFKNKFSHLLNCSIEPVVNLHDPAVIDTIYTFANPKNEIKVYRARHKDFVYLFNVTSRELKMKEGIRTGMKKDLFFKKFQIPVSTRNIVHFSNPDINMEIRFYFKNNRLRKINSQSNLD